MAVVATNLKNVAVGYLDIIVRRSKGEDLEGSYVSPLDGTLPQVPLRVP